MISPRQRKYVATLIAFRCHRTDVRPRESAVPLLRLLGSADDESGLGELAVYREVVRDVRASDEGEAVMDGDRVLFLVVVVDARGAHERHVERLRDVQTVHVADVEAIVLVVVAVQLPGTSIDLQADAAVRGVVRVDVAEAHVLRYGCGVHRRWR